MNGLGRYIVRQQNMNGGQEIKRNAERFKSSPEKYLRRSSDAKSVKN
jgi:hypothetical protein